MKHNDVFGYIRVSDTKQVDGASLSEQERFITEYATTNNLNIIKWFAETKTAAKRGRPKFTEMLSLLKSGKAKGVIIHKIDRSARNLHDWASVGDLIDNGIQVHFAHESLDMTQRGGRLSADIQAVMASDYIRNLKQEIKKGINGRLNQGIFPFAAPIGYINNGKGKLKTIDPIKAPLVKKMFELYLSRKYNFKTLSDEIFKLGLTNLRGNKLGVDGVSKVLNNPFYIGLMRVKNRLYQGNHEALIDFKLFQRVKLIIKNRTTTSGLKHFYLFKQMLKCGHCKYTLSGEKQKGMIYYRCHQKNCPTKTLREDHAEHYFLNVLKQIQLFKSEISMLNEYMKSDDEQLIEDNKSLLMNIEKQLISKEKKIETLLDAYLDNKIDDQLYESKRKELLIEITYLVQEKAKYSTNNNHFTDQLLKFFELCYDPVNTYFSGTFEEKRNLIEIVTSNLEVFGKSLVISIHTIFKLVANRSIPSLCAHKLVSNRKTLPQDYPSKFKYSSMFTSPIIYPKMDSVKARILIDASRAECKKMEKEKDP